MIVGARVVTTGPGTLFGMLRGPRMVIAAFVLLGLVLEPAHAHEHCHEGAAFVPGDRCAVCDAAASAKTAPSRLLIDVGFERPHAHASWPTPVAPPTRESTGPGTIRGPPSGA